MRGEEENNTLRGKRKIIHGEEMEKINILIARPIIHLLYNRELAQKYLTIIFHRKT